LNKKIFKNIEDIKHVSGPVSQKIHLPEGNEKDKADNKIETGKTR
jgi:hypothetical protein